MTYEKWLSCNRCGDTAPRDKGEMNNAKAVGWSYVRVSTKTPERPAVRITTYDLCPRCTDEHDEFLNVLAGTA